MLASWISHRIFQANFSNFFDTSIHAESMSGAPVINNGHCRDRCRENHTSTYHGERVIRKAICICRFDGYRFKRNIRIDPFYNDLIIGIFRDAKRSLPNILVDSLMLCITAKFIITRIPIIKIVIVPS